MCGSQIPSIDGDAVAWVDAAEMREIDRLMTAELGVTLTQMMENAGSHLADLTRALYDPSAITVVVGGGGNAGGGLVAVRHLHNVGVAVTVVPTVAAAKMSLTARMQLQIAERLGIRIAEPDTPGVFRDTVVIDAILGYGLDRDLAPALVSIIESMQQSPVVSLDVPTGFDATNGCFRPGAVRPAATMTLCLPKTGLDDHRASGELYLADISVPPCIVERFGPQPPPPFALDRLLRLRTGWSDGDLAR
ncbi:MAG: NAD(P)H-hydrate epimerase [Ilumatobacteraceae bacterium]